MAHPESSTEAETELIPATETAAGLTRTRELPPAVVVPESLALHEKPDSSVKARQAPEPTRPTAPAPVGTIDLRAAEAAPDAGVAPAEAAPAAGDEALTGTDADGAVDAGADGDAAPDADADAAADAAAAPDAADADADADAAEPAPDNVDADPDEGSEQGEEAVDLKVSAPQTDDASVIAESEAPGEPEAADAIQAADEDRDQTGGADASVETPDEAEHPADDPAADDGGPEPAAATADDDEAGGTGGDEEQGPSTALLSAPVDEPRPAPGVRARPELILKPVPPKDGEPRPKRPAPGPGKSVKVVSPPSAQINLANLRPIAPPTGALPVAPATAAPHTNPPTTSLRADPAATGPVTAPTRAPSTSSVPRHAPGKPGPGPGGTALRRGLLVLAGVVVVALAVVAGLLTDGAEQDAERPVPSAAPTFPVQVRQIPAQITSFTPSGSGFREKGAGWTTQSYSSARFGNLKDGVGLRLDLGGAHTVRAVSFTAGPGPIRVELRAADLPAGDISGYEIVGKPVTGSGTVTMDARAAHRYWMLWVTELAPGDGGFKADVSDIKVTGR